MISKEYLAGLIDGDGHLSLYKHKDKRLKRGWGVEILLKITNTDKKLLELIKKQFGGLLILNYRPKKGKDVYRLEWSNRKDVKNILVSIVDFLIVKKEQAELMIKFCDLRLSKKRHNVPYTKQEWKLIEQINRLNKRGKL